MANPALAAILGYDSIDELLKTRTRDLYVDPREGDEAYAMADAGEGFGVREHQLRRKDGTTFWARMRVRAVRGPKGSAEYMEGVLEDITEAYSVREQLLLSEARFRTAFERSPFPMLLMAPDLRPLAMNKAATTLLDLSEEELQDRGAIGLLTDEGWADAQIRVNELRGGKGDGYTATRQLRLPNGEEKWVILSVNAIRSSDGDVHSFITQFADITDQRRMQQQLEGLVRSKDELVRSVSHELRTPLTTILGLTSVLVSNWSSFSDDDRLELTQLVAAQSEDMAELVDDLLAAAGSETGLLEIEAVMLDLCNEAEAIVEVWEPRAAIKLIVPDQPRHCFADPFRVRQILGNLLSNAVKYGISPITVEVRQENGKAEVSVRDEGPGLPQWQHEAIFDPYYQASTAETPAGSVGLGLTVSRNLARMMNGDLVYQVSDGVSNFVLTLPLEPPA